MKFIKMKKRKGFTLIELVIVVAIIGILMLLVVPQFNNVTENTKLKTFEANYRTVVSAIGMYQAANNGEYPTSGAELDAYVDGNFADLADKPKGATYVIATGPFKFTATYTPTSGGGSTITKVFPE